MNVNELLKMAVEKGASDVHLSAGLRPMIRMHGQLQPLTEHKLTGQETDEILLQISSDEQRKALQQRGEVDFPYSVQGVGRFRVNAYRQRGSVAMAMRVVPARVLSCNELRLPGSVLKMIESESGLLLVTGSTGSGKSTTLAALIDVINKQRQGHVITLEDPVEYLHQHDKCVIHQREIGTDSESFAGALRSALRQDPDVILVGELRDVETMTTALTAAETGHLVMATLHTPDASQAVDRLIDVFSPHQQQQIRIQLAGSLIGIVAQQLIPRCDRPGRVAAFEVLVATRGVRNLIREAKTHQMPSAIQTGARHGMISFANCLEQLMVEGVISAEELHFRREQLQVEG